MTSLLKTSALLSALLLPGLALAADPAPAGTGMPAMKPLGKPITIKFCIFDIMGTTGDAFSYAKDLALEAKKWGVNADLRAYTDERVAAEDFKAGQCDGVAISTMRAKQFNFFIGSIDSPGALPTWRHVRELIASLANPKLAPLTISGPYQVAAVIPLGGAYVMVNDRQINSIEKAAGKKVAVLDFDKAQAKIVQSLGAQPVASDITNFAGKFNNGQVDIIAAPAVAFKPLELYKGLGTKGAIFRFPLAQITATILIRRDKFIKDVPDFDERVQKMREFALSKLDVVERMVNASEADIPKKYWLDLSKADQEKYIRLMREVRINMTKEGMYDKKMMSLMKKVRCRIEPANEECSMNLE
jgi:hypothetical protein